MFFNIKALYTQCIIRYYNVKALYTQCITRYNALLILKLSTGYTYIIRYLISFKHYKVQLL